VVRLNSAQIAARLPQANPFLFVETAELSEQGARGSYCFRGTECFMPGHFPQRPIFPASLMMEALGQLAILWMVERYQNQGLNQESIFFIKSEDVQCRRQCILGDTLDLSVQMLRSREPLIQFAGTIEVAGERALKVNTFSLSFSTNPESNLNLSE
jgi:3-hydroxyacyl-[acyl-carrier-protein] dehydratase